MNAPRIWIRPETAIRNVNVTGMWLAFHDAPVAPVVVEVEATKFLPIFSDRQKLMFTMATILRGKYRVRQITDAEAFLKSTRGVYRIMIDPYTTPEGNTRFKELHL